MLETQNKIYNVLTPDQKKQYNANFEKRLTEKGPHDGKMPPPPADGVLWAASAVLRYSSISG